MLKKAVIAVSIFLALLITAGVFIYFKISPGLKEVEARAEQEQKLLQPRLVKGDGKFERHPFYTSEHLGNISQIRVGWPADREGADIAVVGSRGADFIDLASQIKKQIQFSTNQRGSVTVARTSAAGGYGYLTRDESWTAPAMLFDEEGQLRWRSNSAWGVDDSAPGDVLGDGKLSVVIGFNGSGGIALLDGQGQSVWRKKEGNVWHVETLDIKGNGREEILHSNASGQLLVRGAKGELIAQYLPGVYVSWFAITRWGDESKPTHILVPTTQRREGCCTPVFVVLDAHGKTVAERESPLGDVLNRTAATPVRFGKHDDYFAILQNNFARGRSMLLLYGKDGEIVYQEILGESCLGLAAVPIKDAERLLVGCEGKIWEYSPVAEAQNVPKDIALSKPRNRMQLVAPDWAH
jgi:hypothetical protein